MPLLPQVPQELQQRRVDLRRLFLLRPVPAVLDEHPLQADPMALNGLSSPLRDKSRSFPKAEGFNPQGCSYSLDDHQPCIGTP